MEKTKRIKKLRISRKIIPLFMTAVMIFMLAGCGFDTDYSLESTRLSSALHTSASTSSSVYVRSSFDEKRYPYFAMLTETVMNAYSFI